MKTFRLTYIICLCWLGGLYAQDLHFSQFYSTPLLVNPANTGKMKEDIRLTLVTRNQWAAANSNFKTSALTSDLVIKAKGLKRNKLGVGVLFAHDDLGNGAYKNSNAGLSVAYHMILDKRRNHRLSFGLQGGYTRKYFSGEALLYENQNRYFVFDPSIDPSERLTKGADGNFSYFDGHVGANYKYVISNKWDVETGLSAYQIRQPQETLFKDAINTKNNKLGTR
ncbi:MAG TPA: PorP/SprF family type IX secretion system membrane protein, partial [Cytophagales bacterium]|nr:PorP/SprF family type IX secretion system membrane protein [Cytophagales bacterium]